MELSRVDRRKNRKKRKRIIRITLMVSCLIIGLVGFTATYEFRLWLAGSLLVTQHHHWAKYTLVGEKKLNELRKELATPEIVNSGLLTISDRVVEASEKKEETEKKELLQVIPIEKKMSNYHYFKGYLLKVSDPNRIHLVETSGERRSGKGLPRGEFISEFVERKQALAGVNASGFYDPNWMGYGEKPSGLVISDGKIIQSNLGGGESAVALTYDGKLITGNYTAKQLVSEMNVRDAVSFKPQLIVNGKNLFTGKEATSWGIAPRTAMGQTADGTILFVVIDGRRPTHSLGASMTDMAMLMEEYGAINAMALDGGTSSMLVTRDPDTTELKILTTAPNDDERGRWLPNAWLIY
ncbi:phosphodiester glycosidase family protein [Ammoniphilus sp. CFH 90114]|uniref:phosphodiester glycosidase family protein n=1 Tax=Ammoniphilus sp. CFH 90114 TaxID=2493665 RepID=UPI00100F89F2|nr:phosphodiester glycosidase family protein [Ammoniphilus sp. CFH 90114]RXT06425.1 phosphodiester glycosidase family protein [Ammoniphilus sp. CFH 90114]